MLDDVPGELGLATEASGHEVSVGISGAPAPRNLPEPAVARDMLPRVAEDVPMEPEPVPRGWRRIPWPLKALVVFGVVCLLAAWPVHFGLVDSRIASNERAASAFLKTLASAEADFRGNDRDGNRIQDFWTGDVSGLFYRLAPDGTRLELIEQGVADADARPARPRTSPAVPFRGYYFVAMRRDESGDPYCQDTRGVGTNGAPLYNHSKFGFCAYPADYGATGRNSFFINEGNTIFKQDLQGKPLVQWPRDEDLKNEYSVID
jgi:hypothetical protein